MCTENMVNNINKNKPFDLGFPPRLKLLWNMFVYVLYNSLYNF